MLGRSEMSGSGILFETPLRIDTVFSWCVYYIPSIVNMETVEFISHCIYLLIS